MRMTPETAFVPDMRGVWSMGGTLAMSSKPTMMARTRIVTKMRTGSPSNIGCSFSGGAVGPRGLLTPPASAGRLVGNGLRLAPARSAMGTLTFP